MKVWSFSTTLRSPDRIIDFLSTVRGLENKVWDKETQKEFQTLLIKNRLYGYDNAQFYNGLSDKSISIISDINYNITYEEAFAIFNEKNYEDPAMRGRTSFSPLKELGLVYINDNNKIIVTKLGNDLLEKKIDFEEYFLNWGIKWQYPNPINSDFIDGYNIKPLIGLIKLIILTNVKWQELGNEPVGISKNEFSLFVLTLTDINNLNEQVDKLINYRESLKNIAQRDRNNFFKIYVENNLTSYSNASVKNLKDYTDNAIRYFALTSLIRKRGGGYYIDITPSRSAFISKLLETIDGSSDNYGSCEEYINYLNNLNIPNIDLSSAVLKIDYLTEIESLITENNIYMEELDNIRNYNVKQLSVLRKKILFKLEKNDNLNEEKLTNLINNLENIRNLDISPSMALEKLVNTSLIVINDAIEIKPNFISDEDNNILFTAPAGVTDIECYYKEFNGVCEVTMLTGRNQSYNEGQPVLRHFKEFIDKHSDLNEHYCLFIAPSIHQDTLNTFWYAVKYEYEGLKLKVIPLSLKRFEEILYALRKLTKNNKTFSRSNLKKLYDSISDVNNVKDSNEWWTHINETFEEWKEELIKE